MEYVIWYPKGKDFTLIASSNFDWDGCIDDRKSISGGYFYLDDKLVAWHSNK